MVGSNLKRYDVWKMVVRIESDNFKFLTSNWTINVLGTNRVGDDGGKEDLV
jgi:hypothetical protein